MEENWDDDDFEPQEIKVSAGKGAASNKWEGEDEDDDVKESWEDEEEEKDKSDKSDDKSQIIQKPKKKSIAEKIAEKERLKREEIERRMREEEVEELSEAERLRQQKQSDLKLALETTFGSGGGGENATELGIDGMCPETREEFDEFANTLMKKIQPLVRSTEYPNFSENLVRSICATLTSFDLKKVKTTIDNLYLEKQKIEKGDKTKKNKGKGKVKLKLEQDNNQYSAYAVDDYDDFNDFM